MQREATNEPLQGVLAWARAEEKPPRRVVGDWAWTWCLAGSVTGLRLPMLLLHAQLPLERDLAVSHLFVAEGEKQEKKNIEKE